MDGLNTVVKGMECYGEVDAIISSAVFGKKRGSTINRKGRCSFEINGLPLCLARQFGQLVPHVCGKCLLRIFLREVLRQKT